MGRAPRSVPLGPISPSHVVVALLLVAAAASAEPTCPRTAPDAGCVAAADAGVQAADVSEGTGLFQKRADRRIGAVAPQEERTGPAAARSEPAAASLSQATVLLATADGESPFNYIEVAASAATTTEEQEPHGASHVGLVVLIAAGIILCVGLRCVVDSMMPAAQRFNQQVSALSWKNSKIHTRTYLPIIPCCTWCTTATCQVLTPVIFVALMTLLPNGIVRSQDMLKDIELEHPMQYGGELLNSSETWLDPSRKLEDYLFEQPRVRLQNFIVGSVPLFTGYPAEGQPPAGACFCRTLALVGPGAEQLQAWMERRYIAYQLEESQRLGQPNFLDLSLAQRACPAQNKATMFRVMDKEQINSLLHDFLYDGAPSERNASSKLDRLCGVVEMENDLATAATPRFVLRTNITSSDLTGGVAAKTINLKARDMLEVVPPLHWYIKSGFLSLQSLVEGYIAEQRLGEDVSLPEVDFVPLPMPGYRADIFREALAGAVAGPGQGIAMFAPTIMSIAYFMIRERNSRQKELMRLMGLYDSSLALSWILLFAVMNALTALGCAMCISGVIVEHSSFFLLFLIFFACGMATTAMGMVVSTAIGTERLGALVAFGTYQILGLVSMGLTVSDSSEGAKSPFQQDISPSITEGQLYFVSLIPHVAFMLALKTYLSMDTTAAGCSLGGSWATHERFSVGKGVMIMFLDFFMYCALYCYLDQVVQHDVGVARPWYFPLDPGYWREVLGWEEAPNRDALAAPEALPKEEEEEAHPELFETEDSEHYRQLRTKKRVLTAHGLRKDFLNAAGAHVRAVDGLNLTMYEGECFCLLGHNGAGKSTTMACLTGMTPPSAGEVTVLGMKMPQDVLAIRRNMGFCMQQNVLWDSLTVEEHVLLFAALIGLDKEVAIKSCDEVLRQVELAYKRHAQADELSGGMKRKLNVALSLVGGARVLILDEPTAGMDPHTRRELWSVLKQSRAERIMCLTTHYMDEADELGDRIMIMVCGRAACCGSNAFLKRAMGCGYMLNFVKTTEQVKDGPIVALVRKHCGDNVSEASVVGRELRLRVPFDGAKAFPALMKDLDAKLTSVGLESYGVGVADLEDVFLKVASGHDPQDFKRQTSGSLPVANALGAGVPAADALLPGEPESRLTPTFGRQLIGLLQRRVRYGFRDSRTFCCQIMLPCVVMLLFMAITNYIFKSRLSLEYDQVSLEISSPGPKGSHVPTTISVGIASDASAELAHVGQTWSRSPPAGVVDVLTNSSLWLNASLVPRSVYSQVSPQRREWLLGERSIADWAFQSASQGAPQFGAVFYGPGKVAVLPNMSLQHSAPALLNAHFSEMVRAGQRASAAPFDDIEVASKPLDATRHEAALVNGVSSVSMGMVVMTAYSFIPTGIAAYVAMEKESEFKHQLMVTGTGRVPYWLSNAIFDSIFGIFSLIGTLLIMSFFEADAWLSYPNITGTVTLLLLFVPAASAQAYFASFFFTTSGGALVSVLIFNLMLGSIGMEVSMVLLMFEQTRVYGHLVMWIARFLVPPFCLGKGLSNLAIWKDMAPMLKLGTFNGYVWGTQRCPEFMAGAPIPCAVMAGDDAFMLVVDAVVYGILVLLMDYFGEKSFMRRLMKMQTSEVRCPAELRMEEDEHVAKERERANGLDPATQVLLVKDVHKSYTCQSGNGIVHAVRGISYAVGEGEVFGLLGVNGAGKTTSFKMMCGQLDPSAGSVHVKGRDVQKELDSVRSLIGYCPQFNALLDLLTVREHLELFGQVKGMSGPVLEAEVMDKLRTFDLKRFEHSRAAQLSGGNMRKLSCALAMVGEPPIVFLDEPSAGMDPVARRFMWDVIQEIAQARRGSAVILTTHSMDEADALCSRIGIQASGQLRCLGTPQQLKEWYGMGLELNLRLEVPARREIEQLCRNWDDDPQNTCDLSVAQGYVDQRLGLQLATSRSLSPKGLNEEVEEPTMMPGHGDAVMLGALAEWVLMQEAARKAKSFLQEKCGHGSVTCVESQAGSLRFRLTGDCAGGGPKPYSELFGLIQGERSRLGLSDFQLSQGTLERTFNRIAAEDQALNQVAGSP